MREMLDAVRCFHEKHDFAHNNGHDPFYRMMLMMEEVGEICEALTKGKTNLAEEHADLLILLLGNCIAFDIDIEEAFWEKYRVIMEREAKWVEGRIRVTDG